MSRVKVKGDKSRQKHTLSSVIDLQLNCWQHSSRGECLWDVVRLRVTRDTLGIFERRSRVQVLCAQRRDNIRNREEREGRWGRGRILLMGKREREVVCIELQAGKLTDWVVVVVG